jgi:large subunit ribosomal protein L19
MDVIESFEKSQIKSERPAFNIGDTVRVSLKIKEGDKERLQPFEGVVIAKRNAGARSSFTVRKVSYGIGVERVIPLYGPALEDVKVLRRGDVRRAKLYYLRDLHGKAARIKEKQDW